jgi:DNA repair exonuclease SbcCD ATPase subunit
MQGKVSEMIKMLSTELGIQMIIVSHIPEMVDAADRIINVTKENGISKVTIL